MRTTKIRAFLGLGCADDKLGLLDSYGKRLSILAPQVFRRVRKENFHLTCVFLGDQTLDSLESLASDIDEVAHLSLPAIDFNIISYFPASKSPKVIAALGESSPELDSLVTALTRLAQHHCLNIKSQRRAFKPHISIIRCHGKARSPLPKIYEPIDLRLEMQKLVLFESRLQPSGSVYYPLKVWPVQT